MSLSTVDVMSPPSYCTRPIELVVGDFERHHDGTVGAVCDACHLRSLMEATICG
jgi:hypothetical protein